MSQSKFSKNKQTIHNTTNEKQFGWKNNRGGGGEEGGGSFLNRAGKGWSWLGHAEGRTQTNEPTNKLKLTPHPSPLHLLIFSAVRLSIERRNNNKKEPRRRKNCPFPIQ